MLTARKRVPDRFDRRYSEQEPLPSSDVEETGQRGIDDHYLGRAIDLAWLGAGRTSPNPMVGALIVKEGRVLGAGYHPQYGEDHAETIALERAGSEAQGAALYVTLEPCAHHGNTPPCVDPVIRSGIRRVVVSTMDPDERVNGRGLRVLRERNVDVVSGRLADRAMLLNLAYFKSKLGLKTAITLKIAATLDGKIAGRPGRRDEITGEESRRMVHRLRAAHEGVLVGIDTVLTDRPRLDCRLLENVKPPVPVVLDSHLRFPADHPWLKDRRPFIITGKEASPERESALEGAGARVLRCSRAERGLDLEEAMDALGRSGVGSVLVEGGGKIFSSFLASGVWDGMFVFLSPALFGPEGVAFADRMMPNESLNAVSAGVSMHGKDVLLGFLNGKTRRILADRLL